MRHHCLHVDDLTGIPDIYYEPEVVPTDVEHGPFPNKIGVRKIPPNVSE